MLWIAGRNISSMVFYVSKSPKNTLGTCVTTGNAPLYMESNYLSVNVGYGRGRGVRSVATSGI